MTRPLRCQVTIDRVCVSGAALAHKEALASEIEARLKAMLPEAGGGLSASREHRIAAVRAEPLAFTGRIGSTQLGGCIARQVAGRIASLPGDKGTAASNGEKP